ncbi:hypothetical protein PHA8399_01850 [Leisingera aquaemixtae]|uniref:Uncharacterized protein n=1 Tax=Leisingera aquaemixtae TaxID=1396826 RepID=A0A0P1H8X2_9RHOB|nr:hypothetical protein PHA8399_01850 [Leisingera aquaemixtae]
MMEVSSYVHPEAANFWCPWRYTLTDGFVVAVVGQECA